MTSRLLAATAALGLSVAGLTLPVAAASAAPSASDSDARVNCGWNTHPDKYHRGGVSFGKGTYIHMGPYLACTRVGQGFPKHRIDVHCGVYNSKGVPWVYVRDVSTGKNGWVRASALRGAGTIPNCY